MKSFTRIKSKQFNGQHRKGFKYFYILFPILFTVILCISLFSINKTFNSNEQRLSNALKKVNDINNLLRSLSDLTRWQQTLLSNQEKREIYLAERRMLETERTIQSVIDIIKRKDISKDLEQFINDNITLLEINSRILQTREKDSQSVLSIQYSSLLNILQFRGQILQENAILSANKANSQRILNVIILLIIAIAIIIIISTFLFHNIYKKRKIQFELWKAKNYLQSVINSMPAMVIGIKPDKTIIEINHETKESLKISAEQVKGNKLDKYLPSLGKYLDQILLENKAGKVWELKNIQLLNKMMFNITAYPLVQDDFSGTVILLTNVTKQVKIEEQLRQSQKMSAVGQLAGGVAHDFNNMLTGIMGSMEMLKDYLNDDGLKYYNIISTTTQHASDLVQQLLSFARKNNITLSPVDIHTTIYDTIKLLTHSIPKSIKIHTKLHSTNHVVSGDSAQLENVFLNLGINSAFAVKEKGMINFETREIYLDKTTCENSPFDLSPGPFLQIEVSDDGCGIPAADLPRIFEPFYSTKKEGEGTGLGLSTVYGIISQMKGTLSVYSEEHRGTNFYISLPIIQKPVPKIEKKIPVNTKKSSSILIIDDDDAVRKVAKAFLEKAGYITHTAATGSEGIKILIHNKKISLILLDMIMPDMNGTECYRKLKKINPEIRILLASGFSHHEDVETLKEEGLNGFIPKPYHREKLLNKVYSILENSDKS